MAWRHPEKSGKLWSEVVPSLSKVAQLLYSTELRITSQLEVSVFLLLRQGHVKVIQNQG